MDTYLSIIKPAGKNSELEGQSKQHDISQIFMETPYRNSAMITRILSHCKDETRLCVACDVSLDTEEIISKPISEWKKKQKHPDHTPSKWNKRPVIYLLYAH